MVAFLMVTLLAAGPVGDPQHPHVREVAERSADPRDKMICKRFVETGSLIAGYRTCKTKAEWDRERDNIRNLNSTDSCRARADGGAC